MNGAALGRPQPDAREKGFTLLEVLVATSILGVAIVALLGLHGRNLALTAEAQDLTVAGALASNVIAASRLDPTLAEGSSRGRFVSRANEADGVTAIYGGSDSKRFVWSREITPTALPTLRQVRVRVGLAGEERVLAEMWVAVSGQVGPP